MRREELALALALVVVVEEAAAVDVEAVVVVQRSDYGVEFGGSLLGRRLDERTPKHG